MARVTVEDCIEKVSDQFELVVVAAQRAKMISAGEKPTVERDDDKDSVLALREIAEGTVDIEDIKEALIARFQKGGFKKSAEESTEEIEELPTSLDEIEEESSFDIDEVDDIHEIEDED